MLRENHSGKATLLDLLKRNELTLPDEIIASIVVFSVHYARKQVRRAKKNGGGELLDWRVNLVRSFDSVILAMLKAKTGEVLEAPFHCEEVNELLLESGAVFKASQVRAAAGTPIRCEERHDNGKIMVRVLESEYITLKCMSLSTDERTDNTYLCCVCARPIAINHVGKGWFVCTGSEWVG